VSTRGHIAFVGLLLWLPVGLGVSCNDDDVVWVRFNGNDSLEVQVTADEALGPPESTDLTSTTGAVLVGSASVDPGSAPVGTDHEVVVQIDDDYEETVGRVSVEVDAGARGIEEFDLRQDSADHGHWLLQVRSVGETGEERTDRFAFRLWVPDDSGDIIDTGNGR
jgi:hypothetical protein